VLLYDEYCSGKPERFQNYSNQIITLYEINLFAVSQGSMDEMRRGLSLVKKVELAGHEAPIPFSVSLSLLLRASVRGSVGGVLASLQDGPIAHLSD
jgi:hypothetical protein